jgi:SAM-dependent methyltransferase
MPEDEAEFKAAVSAYYRSTAGEYDRGHYDEADSSFLRSYFHRAAAGRPVLDIGAGTGRVGEWLGGKVMALDLSLELLKAGREARRFSNAVVCGEAQALPFRDRSVPVVSAINILHHCFDPSTVVEEMARVAESDVMIVDSVGWLSHVKDRLRQATRGAAAAQGRVYFCPGDGYCTRAELWRLVGILKRRGFRLRARPVGMYGMPRAASEEEARWLRWLPWRLTKSVLIHATRKGVSGNGQRAG